MDNILPFLTSIVFFFVGMVIGERRIKKDMEKISDISDKAFIEEISGKKALGQIREITDKYD